MRKDPQTNEHPNIWPRRSLDPRWWRWRVVVSHKWHSQEEHINKLELRSILSALKWRCRVPSRLACRFFHLSDSAVCLGVVVRARSSSMHLQLVSDRVNSYLLAANLRPIVVHVSTKLNPADGPSRRILNLKKKFLRGRLGLRGPSTRASQGPSLRAPP